jgi:nitrogen-specific signal transduction histidine kinase
LVRDDVGRPLYFISQIQDITERKRVMEELVAAKETAEAGTRVKSEFLAMISHEIRTPLNPILGAAQLLLDEKSTPEQQELLRVIQNAGEHLLTLLSDLLDLAKMESGAVHLVQTASRIGELVQGVFDIKSEEARRKHLALKLELDPALAYAYLVDEPRLRQILLNFIGNAVKFTNQGEVMVRIERLEGDARRDRVRVNVSDTGIGIAKEHLRRIFEPFYQVDNSLMRQHEGAGLGLAICQRLVETMGGEIGAESRPGVGSTFWFSLWLERRRSLDEIGTPWPMPIASLRRHSILLATANEKERVLLVNALEKAGCEVTRVTAGADVLNLFKPGNFDLLLIDQELPDFEWPQLAQTLRQREVAAGDAAASIVLLTRDGSEAVRKMAQGVGVNSLLVKPVRQVELLRMLMLHGPLPSSGSETTIPPPSKARD